MAIAKINKPHNPEDNFWELNPQMKYYKPFNKLYERDKSEDKIYSSKEMHVIFFMCDPDEDLNIYYRMSDADRLSMLKETYCPEVDLEDEVFLECLEAYPFEMLDAVERALKIEKDQLKKRTKLIENTELTLDRTEIVEDGRGGQKTVTIKGTASQINTLQKDFPKIMQQYEEVEQKFLKNKEVAKVRGGSKLSKAEKKDFW